MGVCRRNPDVRYRYREGDLKAFQERQLKLLEHVSNLVLPGGIILYTVCSLEPEEGPQVVERFLNKNRNYFIIDLTRGFHIPLEAGLERFFTGEGFFITLPHRDDMDGFFAARLSRSPA